MRLYVGTAQDIVVKRTIEKNEQAPRRRQPLRYREVVLKFEIENFKDKAVTLDVSESVRHPQRSDPRHGPGRRMGAGRPDDLPGGKPDKQMSTFDKKSSSTSICPPAVPTPKPPRSSTSSISDHQERMVAAFGLPVPAEATSPQNTKGATHAYRSKKLLPQSMPLVAFGRRTPLKAKNVDLSTVPDRDTVQLTIYNSEDLTLVRETRKVSFKPGANPCNSVGPTR